MSSLNKVMLIGNLGSDPVKRFTQSGSVVVNFNLATNERWKDQSGQLQEKTEWHRIVVFGRQAENCEKFLSKGRSAYVEGKLQTNKWTDKDGKDRYTTEIVAQNVVFLQGGASAGAGAGGGYNSNSMNQGGGMSQPAPSFDQSFNDDDIPF